jgi:hypothetical protein
MTAFLLSLLTLYFKPFVKKVNDFGRLFVQS